MKNLMLRHFERFNRLSLIMLAFGLGHKTLSHLGTTGGIVAADMITVFGARMAIYLFELTRRANTTR
jgi:hypothetical protein